MTHIYNNTRVCEGCPNNPANNHFASGICCCSLPYMTPAPLPQRHLIKPREYERYERPYTVTVSDSTEPLTYDFMTGTYSKNE